MNTQNTNKQLSSHTINSSVPAACGELVQGSFGNHDFLINAPIDWLANARFRCQPGNGEILGSAYYEKAIRALSESNKKLRGTLKIDSSLPRGKGMASSTAEIAAALGTTYSIRELLYLHQQVLKTDGSTDATYYSGITWVKHLTGYIIEQLPSPTNLGVVIVDQQGEVSTNGFDRVAARRHANNHQFELEKAVDHVRKGLISRRLDLIGMGASMSSLVNHKILPKQHLKTLLRLVDGKGVVGINSAHTGTVLGVLFDKEIVADSLVLKMVQDAVGSDNVLDSRQIIGGFLEQKGLNQRKDIDAKNVIYCPFHEAA